MKFMLTMLHLVAVLVPAVADTNPHDGYFFWLPAGHLTVGDKASEARFQYKVAGDRASFTIKPRAMRFGAAKGQFVLVPRGGNSSWLYTIDGKDAGSTGAVTFLPLELTEGKQECRIEISVHPGQLHGFRLYYTDDFLKLGGPIHFGSRDGLTGDYTEGLSSLLVRGDFSGAEKRFRQGSEKAKTPEAARLLRRLARWASAESKFKEIKTGPGFYDLGLYCMVNGCWELAASCFRRATELMPKNPDAWYMLADALSYRDSDLLMDMEKIYPYYKKAADLYPHDKSNTYRNFVALFRKLREKEGDKERVLTISDEQIAYSKKMWEWCSAILAASSHGALRMVNTFHVYDKEFDNRGEYDPRPFEGLFKPGTTEAFVKMTGWGASDTLGHDCGPDRSAALNLGIREWDVFYHEWNHSLDWLMITSELGIGVPETHSSDWCGFEPISSMGMGHHSCNRYYMTPGMYRMIRGSDPPTTPHIDTWEVSGPTTLLPETDKPDDAFQSRLKDFRDQVVANRLTLGPARAVTATNGYLDFKSMWPGMSLNALAMASCYVYSPVHQRVRMWMGYDDNAVVFLNGQKVFGGLYWTLVRFQESREKDRVATGITLEKGWNHLEICVTNGQHGEDWLEPGKRSDVWGLSVRFCDLFNRGVSGLKWQAEKPVSDSAKPRPYFEPSNPVHYRWSDVAYDYTALLPHLTETDIGALLGLSFKASDQMWFITDKSSITAGPPNPSQIKFDNVLNWFFSPKENAAYVSTRNFDGRNWTTRELLFLRPEAYESYLKLMRVTPEAKGKGIKSHADRVIGYLTVPRSDSLNGRIVLVVDTYLGDKLPLDEEDLLDISHLK